MSAIIHDLAIIVSATASMVAAIASMVSILMSLRNGRKIEVVRLESNSMKDELVKATADKCYAEGVKHGEDNPRHRMIRHRKD